MKNRSKILLLFLAFTFNSKSMDHAEQEIKIADEEKPLLEVSLETSVEKQLSELDQIDNFLKKSLNEHFPNVLSDIILSYVNKKSEYKVKYEQYLTIKSENYKITQIIQLQNGSLATCNSNGFVEIWNLNKDASYEWSQTIKHILEDFKFTQIIQLTNDNLAILNDRGFINIYNLNKNGLYEFLCTIFYNINENPKAKYITILNNASLASCDVNGCIDVWISESRLQVYMHAQTIMYQKSESPKAQSIIWLQNGNLASCDIYGYIDIWQLNKNIAEIKLKKTLYKHFQFICFDKKSPQAIQIIQLQNGSLASCNKNGNIDIWALKENSQYEHFQTIQHQDTNTKQVIELKNGSLASCNSNGYIDIWDLNENGLYAYSQTISSKDESIKAKYIIELQNRSLAFCDENGFVQIWKKTIEKKKESIIQNISPLIPEQNNKAKECDNKCLNCCVIS